MKQVINIIKNCIEECGMKGKMFQLPQLNRSDVIVTEAETKPQGSALYSHEYKIDFNNGDWIKIVYESRDNDRTFQINPDKSIIFVMCSDSSLNFNSSWNEKL